MYFLLTKFIFLKLPDAYTNNVTWRHCLKSAVFKNCMFLCMISFWQLSWRVKLTSIEKRFQFAPGKLCWTLQPCFVNIVNIVTLSNISSGTTHIRQTNVKVTFPSRKSFPPFIMRSLLNCSCIIDDLQINCKFLYFYIFLS